MTHTNTREILAVLIGACCLASCSKDGLPERPDMDNAGVTARIETFIHNVNSGTDRSGLIGLDSAVWYLEAALNYTCTTPWTVGADQEIDSTTIVLPLVNEGTTMAGIGQSFLTLSHQLCTVPHGRALHVVDVSSETIGDSLRLIVASVTVQAEGRAWGDVGPQLHLWFGDWAGVITNCGCGPDEGASSACADKKVEARMNWAVGPIEVGTYFTDVVTIDAGLGSVYSCNGTAFTDECTCLSPATIDANTNMAWWLFGHYQPTGKAKISAFLYSDQTLGGDDSWFGTGAEFKYGVKHTGNPNL